MAGVEASEVAEVRRLAASVAGGVAEEGSWAVQSPGWTSKYAPMVDRARDTGNTIERC